MLLSNLDLLATAPGGVAHLRELILTLAVQGKLVPQDPVDEPASVLLQKIRAEKDRLIAEGQIKRDKPLAEIAEEEKPFGLPQGWEWVRLGDFAAEDRCGKYASKVARVYVSSGVKFLRSRMRGTKDCALMADFHQASNDAKMAGTVDVANELAVQHHRRIDWATALSFQVDFDAGKRVCQQRHDHSCRLCQKLLSALSCIKFLSLGIFNRLSGCASRCMRAKA